ncbi:MAG: DUF2007 domain-containing protein [Candidatus Omnitrophica bacterium]|nr:DUF2007 domain-containing protein [Candidatus Omnitrophota bacterium]MCA9418452.1 DUF2007 domain-containing protein [Candidatus Omnitrophota bacterium]MCA9428558.1 DUF2007 domain-containing protein [Candidatus Omnitrophota bacterium]MCA9432499.1 DUF2007 domain-containing protein [Candidatus Omnitrophota bacterium]MCA9435992.1 DUF2007 domain-containing protein [Candidatus Omnitrophota bacterium]
MSDALVTVKRFTYPWEADLAREVLESEGIPAFVRDSITVTNLWVESIAMGGVRLQVEKDRLDEARQVLSVDHRIRLVEPEVVDEDAYVCPDCHSTHLFFIRKWRQFSALSWLIAGFPLIFPPKRFKCADCGGIWKKSEVAPVREDPPSSQTH